MREPPWRQALQRRLRPEQSLIAPYLLLLAAIRDRRRRRP